MGSFFFFNDTATTEIYTLSLHDALPISFAINAAEENAIAAAADNARGCTSGLPADRKSTRLNSSHSQISYAVFCLKKKKNSHGPDRDVRSRCVASGAAARAEVRIAPSSA